MNRSRGWSPIDVRVVALLSLVAGVSGCREAAPCSDTTACDGDASVDEASFTPGASGRGNDGGGATDFSNSAEAGSTDTTAHTPDASASPEDDPAFGSKTPPAEPVSSVPNNTSGVTDMASGRADTTESGTSATSEATDARSPNVDASARPDAGTLDGGGDAAATSEVTTGPEALWPEVFELFVANCNTGSFCHEAKQLPPQLVGEEQAVRTAASGRAARIAEMVLSETMPPKQLAPLREEDKQLIAAWASAQ